MPSAQGFFCLMAPCTQTTLMRHQQHSFLVLSKLGQDRVKTWQKSQIKVQTCGQFFHSLLFKAKFFIYSIISSLFQCLFSSTFDFLPLFSVLSFLRISLDFTTRQCLWVGLCWICPNHFNQCWANFFELVLPLAYPIMYIIVLD